MVYPLCEYGHQTSNNRYVHLYMRIVNHRCHICMVYLLYGNEHVFANNNTVRIVHHGYHICMVYPLCGYGHGTSKYYFLRIVHHMCHISMVSPQCGTDMGLQATAA